jgi:hypothetical protein
MKTSEDKLNEALRAALKRKFDHFEDAPNPTAFEKIRANLKPARQWKYLFFTLLFVGMGITGIQMDQHFLKTKANKVGTSAAVNRSASSLMKGNPVAMPAAVKIRESKVDIASQNSALRSSNVQKNRNINKIHQGQISGLQQESRFTVTKQYFASHLHSAGAQNIGLQNASPASASEYGFETDSADNQELVITANTLSIQPARFAFAPLNLPKVAISGQPRIIADKADGRVNLLFNAAVLQSYQILTVPSGAQEFQNFRFPSTFSLQSLGYKLSIGAEKKGFQFLFSYSRFQQSYSYEIAGSDYVVEPIDKDKFNVIRQGTLVNQENKFSLLGLGVKKQVTWGNANVGKYYASAGLEYSYGLIRKQSIGWVNASIGKQFPISKGTSLHLGPYAEFSPVKFSGSGDPFFYQPYRVGISAGFRLNH